MLSLLTDRLPFLFLVFAIDLLVNLYRTVFTSGKSLKNSVIDIHYNSKIDIQELQFLCRFVTKFSELVL